MRDCLHPRAHEIAERPFDLSDHEIAVEGNIEESVEDVGVGKIDEKVVRWRSHALMSKNNPDDDTIAACGQQDDETEQEHEDELEQRDNRPSSTHCSAGVRVWQLTCTVNGRADEGSSCDESFSAVLFSMVVRTAQPLQGLICELCRRASTGS